MDLGILEDVQWYNKLENDNPMLLQKACENVLIDYRMFRVIYLLIDESIDVGGWGR